MASDLVNLIAPLPELHSPPGDPTATPIPAPRPAIAVPPPLPWAYAKPSLPRDPTPGRPRGQVEIGCCLHCHEASPISVAKTEEEAPKGSSGYTVPNCLLASNKKSAIAKDNAQNPRQGAGSLLLRFGLINGR